MSAYKDVLLKTSFYKEQVVKDMIKKGIMPDDRVIQERLERIDKFISLYSHSKVITGSYFDVDKFKEGLELIHTDLTFLYQLLYEQTVKEYQYTRAYIDAHLIELEALSERYKLKSKMEIDSTSLGKTIFFQSSSFSTFNKDNNTYVNLGTIKPKEGSTIALLFDAGNVEAEHAVLGLRDGDDIYYASPYNYVQDTFKVPGKSATRTHTYEIDEDQIVNTSFEVISDKLIPSEKNRYLIFGGPDQMSLRNGSVRSLVKKDENNTYHSFESGFIQFHIYKGTYAKFNFTRKPEEKNFKGNSIDRLSPYHTITMRSDEEIAFNLLTDGEVYAEMREGVVRDGKLYYPQQSKARSFLIEEVYPGKEKKYEAFLRIDNRNELPVNINSVAIKELSELEVVGK